MKTKFFILASVLISLARPQAFAQTTTPPPCKLEACTLPEVIDCGRNGEFSYKLQQALSTLPINTDPTINTPVRPDVLNISVKGKCIGPYLVHVFDVEPNTQINTFKSVADRINIGAAYEIQRNCQADFTTPDTCNQDADCQWNHNAGQCESSHGVASGSKIPVIMEGNNSPILAIQPVFGWPNSQDDAPFITRISVSLTGMIFRNGRGTTGQISNAVGYGIGNIYSTLPTTASGGAIINYGSLDIADSVFEDNLAYSTPLFVNGQLVIFPGQGGAIYNGSNAISRIKTSQFTRNKADDHGAAIYNFGGSVRVESSKFYENIKGHNDTICETVPPDYCNALPGCGWSDFGCVNVAGCPNITNEAACTSTPTCSWTPYPPSGTCTGCPNITDETTCSLTPTCSWTPNPPSGICNTVQSCTIDPDAICNVTPECAWNDAISSCVRTKTSSVIFNFSSIRVDEQRPMSVIQSSFLDAVPHFAQVHNQTGDAYITNSTLTTTGTPGTGVGVTNRGVTFVTYSTIAFLGQGINNENGYVFLSNSIVARNITPSGVIQNCVGAAGAPLPTSPDRYGLSLTDVTTIPVLDPNTFTFVQVPTYPCGIPAKVLPVTEAQLDFAPQGVYTNTNLGPQLVSIPVRANSIAIYGGDPNICKEAVDASYPVGLRDINGFGRSQPLPPGSVDSRFDPQSPNYNYLLHLKARGEFPLAIYGDKESKGSFCTIGASELLVDEITISNPGSLTYGNPPFSLLALSTRDPNLTGLDLQSSTPSICSVSGATVTIHAAGDCRISSFSQNRNERDNGNGTFFPPLLGTLTERIIPIQKADLTITAPIGTMTYGGTVPPLVPTFNGFKYNDTQLVTQPTCGPTNFTNLTPAGTYLTSCTGINLDPNYRIIHQPGSLTVNKAPLRINASGGEMVYGTNPPLQITDLSIQGFVNNETKSVLTPNPPSCGFFNPSTGTIDPFTITTPAGEYQTACTATAGNYEIAPIPQTCFADRATPGCSFATVKQAPLVITALSGSMVYGDQPPVITPGYSGFKAIPTVLEVPPTCQTEATQFSGVANSPYVSKCFGAQDNNYSIQYVDGKVTVTPAPLKVQASDAQGRFGTVPDIFPIYTGLKNGEIGTSTPPTCVSSSEPLSPISGTYVSSCSGDVDPNYTITYLPGVVTIVSGLLQIIAPTYSIIFGEPIPEIIPDILGIGAVDPANLLPPICSTTATNQSHPGTYKTVCDRASLENFDIAYFEGAITIKKAPTTTTMTTSTGQIGQNGVSFDVLVNVISTYGNPTGKVTVKARTGETCDIALVEGAGKCQLNLKTNALQVLRASYVGDGDFAASDSKDYLFGIVKEASVNAATPTDGGCMNNATGNNPSALIVLVFGLILFFVRRFAR